MDRYDVKYKSGQATHHDIVTHLSECDMHFSPPLHTYVDIQQYGENLYRNATNFEAWSDDRLIGLVGIYLNDPARALGFISNVSVARHFQGLGIATRLIEGSLESARKERFKGASVEVSPYNEAAIRLYARLGFTKVETSHRGWIVMCLCLE